MTTANITCTCELCFQTKSWRRSSYCPSSLSTCSFRQTRMCTPLKAEVRLMSMWGGWFSSLPVYVHEARGMYLCKTRSTETWFSGPVNIPSTIPWGQNESEIKVVTVNSPARGINAKTKKRSHVRDNKLEDWFHERSRKGCFSKLSNFFFCCPWQFILGSLLWWTTLMTRKGWTRLSSR